MAAIGEKWTAGRGIPDLNRLVFAAGGDTCAAGSVEERCDFACMAAICAEHIACCGVPNYGRLIVTTRGKVLSIRRPRYAIDGCRVTTIGIERGSDRRETGGGSWGRGGYRWRSCQGSCKWFY